MSQVQSLARAFIFFGEPIDRFEALLVINTRIVKIDHDIILIFVDIE